MLTSTSSRLLRFLLSLVARFRLSITVVLRTLWPFKFAFTRPITHSRVQLHPSNVPGHSTLAEDRSQRVGVDVEETQAQNRNAGAGPPASPPDRVSPGWRKRLSSLQQLTSNGQRFEHFSLSHRDCKGRTPEGASQRYYLDKSKTDSLFKLARGTIPAGQHTLLLPPSSLPEGWEFYIHPEGVRLFYHEQLHIFTEHDVSDRDKQAEILCFARTLVEKAIQADCTTLDESTEIVLNVDKEGVCHYYFVDHTNRLLFWVDEVGVRNLRIDPLKNSGYGHIIYGRITLLVCIVCWHFSLIYNLQPRSHCEYYPHTRLILKPRDVFEDLKRTLNYAKLDMITTDSSSSPFGQDELVAMLDLLDSIKCDDKTLDTHNTWTIARLMIYFTENQYLNFCGQPCARLNADTPLFDKPKWHRQPLFRIINLFLLGSPNEHALRLQRVWVDETIIQPRWKDFVNRLSGELGRYTIFSTVMLAVNFSFLALPNLKSPSIQIIIYCSLVSTVASIVFSFGLLNVYSNPRLLIVRHAAQAFGAVTGRGMPGLAITHSLPIASLIWSIALFSAALGVQIFSPKDLVTVVTLSIEGLVIVLFVIVGVSVMRPFSQDDGGVSSGMYAFLPTCRRRVRRGDSGV